MIALPSWLVKLEFTRLGFIGNANAGPSRRRKNQEQLFLIQTLVNDLNDRVEAELGYSNFITYIRTSSIADLAPSLRRLINEKKIQILFIFGGDGSLHKVLDILMYELFIEKRIDYLPIIASLGGGTMLAVHSWLGWGRNSYEIMKKIIYTDFEHLPLKKIRPLAMTLKRSALEIETRFGFMFVMGAIARIIQKYDQDGRSVGAGIKHLMLGMTGAIFGWPKTHCNLTPRFAAGVYADGSMLAQHEIMSVICSVTNSLLFGMAPFRGQAASNQFYTLLSSLSAAQISVLVPLLYRGTIKLPDKIFFNQATAELIIVPEKEKLIFLDGDFYRATPGQSITIKRGPAIKMVSAF